MSRLVILTLSTTSICPLGEAREAKPQAEKGHKEQVRSLKNTDGATTDVLVVQQMVDSLEPLTCPTEEPGSLLKGKPGDGKALIARDVVAERLETKGEKDQKAEDADLRLLKGKPGDGKALIARRAVEALGRMGKEAEEVVPQLIEMLKDESAYVQMQAAETLGEIAEKAEAAVPALIEALKPRTEGSVTYFGVPQFAAKALGKIGEKAAPAVPALIEALKVQAVRSEAAKALMKIEAKGQGPSPTVIEAVVKSFKSQESWAQPDLFKDLAAVGENAGPVLISLMKDADDLISWKASRALETSSPEVISLLPQEMITGGLTQSHELQMRLIVKGLIEKFGGVAVLDVLLRDFSSGDIVYQRSVLYLMGLGGFELSAAGDAEMRQRYGNFKPRLFPNLNRVRGVLEEGLQNPDLRLNAIWALGEMGGLSAWAIPSMVRIYRNSRFHYEKIRVIEAWGKMGRSAQGVRDLLLRETRLAGWDPLRFAAVRSLGQIAQANDAEVIDVLTQIASQPRSESLAGAAAEALDFIQSQMTTP